MCYVGPLAAAAVTTLAWRKNKSINVWWLMLMFYGASLFGVIDHLWNGELFLISKEWAKDLSLGIVITMAIFIAWKIILVLAKKNVSLSAYIVTAGK